MNKEIRSSAYNKTFDFYHFIFYMFRQILGRLGKRISEDELTQSICYCCLQSFNITETLT